MSQWADRFRQLSSEASAEPGGWDTSRAEYQRGIMDACASGLSSVVIMSSAQIGKTEILNNILGYYIDYQPCSILVVQPNLQAAQMWSKERLAPMIRDTPALRQKVSDVKARDSSNTILQKQFPGGYVAATGAESPAGLCSRPVRVLLMDEVDRYPDSAGTEGDPVDLATARTKNFWNRLIIATSTPTVKGFSRIEKAFLESDQSYYFIPCPRCGEAHVLKWGNIVWGERTPAKGDPRKAVFQCPHCSGFFSNGEKNAAVRIAPNVGAGWRATAPFTGKPGFHIWEAYSPWRELWQIVESFLAAKGDPQRLKTWVNTTLGETWEDAGEVVHDHELQERCETYAAPVPARALYLTAGVDTQPDRLEVEVVAWGKGEESWSIDHHVIYGDPDIKEGTPGSPWDTLTDYVRRVWQHESGAEVSVSHTMIDSGGHNTTAVYEYCKRHKGDRIYPIKGKGGDLPIVGGRQRTKTGKSVRPVDLFIVGVDNGKHAVMNRLRIKDPGPGYCHFPQGRDPEWFRQLTSEKLVTSYKKGRPSRKWELQSGRRNEALDCRVYAYAAFLVGAPQLDKVAFRLKADAARRGPLVVTKPSSAPTPAPEEDTNAQDPEPSEPIVRPRPARPKRRGGYVSAWR